MATAKPSVLAKKRFLSVATVNGHNVGRGTRRFKARKKQRLREARGTKARPYRSQGQNLGILASGKGKQILTYIKG